MRIAFLLPLLAGMAFAAEPLALFNGKNLDGWEFDVITEKVAGEEIWSVKDGTLACKGRPPSVLRTKEDFSNYQLTVEWRWVGKPGNSGVLLHASKPRETYIWPKSIEVQLRDGDAGDLWVIGETVGESPGAREGRRMINLTDGSEKPAGEWNTMTIRCEGNTLVVQVNGTKVNEAKGISASKGAICLQSEGGEIHFRKVEILALP